MNNISGHTKAIIAYCTFIGMIIAYFLNKDDKHEFATWHIKNMFGLVILLFASVALQGYEFGFYVYWTAVCLWLFCFLMAIFKQKVGIPFLSEKFQSWFRFLD
ncbi:hypothetical protein POV27_07900 [Aureisphaera galaxeae]|uniref:hypothetical protein n=1 Tax=Aureisphaera galaxeae TaxID=1538023 RepID=UPI002350236B|nr:hypothetical protein [Aureisphaera galaxeae]MDC8003972.1 hypothetical protein [Aureisphaera galaxeae]